MAIVDRGRLLANVTSSQVVHHLPFGGVVPEIASRKHLEGLEATLDLCLAEADLALSDLNGVAATYAPGLVGSLLVGLNFGKGLALSLKKPFRGVHHIEGHLWSPFLEHEWEGPFLGLVVSGGHSHLYGVEGLGQYRPLGQTVDDAAGEAFDKVAKMMGLPYPGGPAIEAFAQRGDPHAFEFAIPKVKKNPGHTSFSGMKTAALDYFKRIKGKNGESSNQAKADLAASFQYGVVRALGSMVEHALEQYKPRQLIVAGGVACNQSLRKAMEKLAENYQLRLKYPSPKFCTDNGAMIALTGEMYLQKGQDSSLALNAQAREPLGSL